jgi:hypothetical protein
MVRVDRTAFPKLKSQMPPPSSLPSSLSLSNPPTTQRKNIFKLINIGDRLLHAAIIVIIQYEVSSKTNATPPISQSRDV